MLFQKRKVRTGIYQKHSEKAKGMAKERRSETIENAKAWVELETEGE